MAYSSNYTKVKRWYVMGMWNKSRVRNAVTMGWITENEYEEIVGEAYN